jgi:hypothetical protein
LPGADLLDREHAAVDVQVHAEQGELGQPQQIVPCARSPQRQVMDLEEPAAQLGRGVMSPAGQLDPRTQVQPALDHVQR